MKFHNHVHTNEGRPLIAVTGSQDGDDYTSEYWDFTLFGSKWEYSSKSFVIHF